MVSYKQCVVLSLPDFELRVIHNLSLIAKGVALPETQSHIFTFSMMFASLQSNSRGERAINIKSTLQKLI